MTSRVELDVVRPTALAAVVAAGLAGLALVGTAALGGGIFVAQVVLALAWLAAIDAKGSQGAFVIAVAAAAAADVAVAVHGSADIGQAAPVAGIAIVVAFLHQLARRPRRALTASLAATTAAVMFGLCGTAYLALVRDGAGDVAVAAALFGVGTALALARACDLVMARPRVFRGSRRGVLGIFVGCVGAAAVGSAYGSTQDALRGGIGLRMAVIAAVIAVVADVAVDAVLVQAPPQDERRLSALTPLWVLLPVVLAGPVAYIAGRILLG